MMPETQPPYFWFQRVDLSQARLVQLLVGCGRAKEAEDHCRQGLVLWERLMAQSPAVDGYRDEMARTHALLGSVLASQGYHQEAGAAYWSCAEWRARIVSGEGGRPDRQQRAALRPEDEVALAVHCQRQSYHAAAAWLYASAFAKKPGLADARTPHRYNAACCAAMAGAGKARDSYGLDAKERGRLRRQARNWLRDDLAGWGELLASDPDGVREQMERWQNERNLAGVRESDALDGLPDAERQEWRGLWADVEKLRQRAAHPGQGDQTMK
jgi:hypothetical protein